MSSKCGLKENIVARKKKKRGRKRREKMWAEVKREEKNLSQSH